MTALIYPHPDPLPQAGEGTCSLGIPRISFGLRLVSPHPFSFPPTSNSSWLLRALRVPVGHAVPYQPAWKPIPVCKRWGKLCTFCWWVRLGTARCGPKSPRSWASFAATASGRAAWN